MINRYYGFMYIFALDKIICNEKDYFIYCCLYHCRIGLHGGIYVIRAFPFYGCGDVWYRCRHCRAFCTCDRCVVGQMVWQTKAVEDMVADGFTKDGEG